jgi:hypothetical protein
MMDAIEHKRDGGRDVLLPSGKNRSILIFTSNLYILVISKSRLEQMKQDSLKRGECNVY